MKVDRTATCIVVEAGSKEAYAQRDSHQRPSWKALRAGFDCQGMLRSIYLQSLVPPTCSRVPGRGQGTGSTAKG